MQINGFDEDELKALCTMWNIGTPIDVLAFLDRNDIPEEAKQRVREAGSLGVIHSQSSNERLGEMYREAQAQIIIEVSRLVLP